MKRTWAVALGFALVLGAGLPLAMLAKIACAQWDARTVVIGNGAIRVYMDHVEFDWQRVRACASMGDTMCRIAQAAREGR